MCACAQTGLGASEQSEMLSNTHLFGLKSHEVLLMPYY